MHRSARGLGLALLLLSSGCWFGAKATPDAGPGGGGGGGGTSSGGNSSGGGSTSSGSGTSGSSATCAQVAQAACDYLSRCQFSTASAPCVTTLAEDCVKRVDASDSAGRQRADPAKLQSCQSSAQAAPCNLGGLFSAFAQCDPSVVYSPNVPEGGACQSREDCQRRPDGGSPACLAPKGSCAGTCRFGLAPGEACGTDAWSTYLSCEQGYCAYGLTYPDGGAAPQVCSAYATLGQSCQGLQCDSQTYCDSPPGQQLCQALTLAQAGQPCSSTGSCQTGLYCWSADGGYLGRTCKAQEGAGSDCSVFYDACDPASTFCSYQGSTATCVALAGVGQSCSGVNCVPSAYCDYFTNSTCAARVGAGQGCSSDDQCQPGTWCHALDGGYSSRTCVAQVGAGADCSESTQACGPGSWCDYSSNNTCVATLDAGADCSGGGTCQPGTTCSYVPGTPTCQPRVGPGQACSSSGDCQADYYCHSPDGGYDNRTCAPTLAAGAPCSDTDYGSCGTSATCSGGSCVPYQANPGQLCVVGTTYCMGNSYCQGADAGSVGLCTSRQPVDAGIASVPGLGEACTLRPDGGSDCYVYRCQGGTCRPQPDLGEACTGTCRFGLYCSAMGSCRAASNLGGPCEPQNSDSCAQGHCGASSTCVDFLAPGQPCDPAAMQCSSDTSYNWYPDGGSGQTDSYCLALDGGAPVCAPRCN